MHGLICYEFPSIEGRRMGFWKKPSFNGVTGIPGKGEKHESIRDKREISREILSIVEI